MENLLAAQEVNLVVVDDNYMRMRLESIGQENGQIEIPIKGKTKRIKLYYQTVGSLKLKIGNISIDLEEEDIIDRKGEITTNIEIKNKNKLDLYYQISNMSSEKEELFFFEIELSE